MRIGRRAFSIGALAFGVASATKTLAYETCGPQACEAGIDIRHISANYDSQYQSQWCWAASISMVFRHYGYRVSQERIVRETYGVVGNIPAVTGFAISKNLDREWQDDEGQSFSVEIEGLYDADAGIMSLTNGDIVDALRDERPLIIGNRSHAMVMTAVAYVPYPGNPQIFNFGVADPFPGAGLHGAQPRELYPMHMGGDLRYLCLPRVQES